VASTTSCSRLVLLYGLLSAALYCTLMPLWEGFDELYHYGYVQYLSTRFAFPVVGKTNLSLELWRSLDFVPVSHFIQPYLQRPSVSFGEYFRLPIERREEMRREMDGIDAALQAQPSPRENYEAKQSPLTYLLLAPVDAALGRASLTRRVLCERVLLSLASIGLLWVAVRQFGTRLGLRESTQMAALFVLFSCQMLYATSCHVANDALLAPWLLFFLGAALDSWKRAAVLMALGTLIKASTIIFVPLALLSLWGRGWRAAAGTAAVLLALAGPWYARNLILYRNLTATSETSGLGVHDLAGAAFAVPWRHTLAAVARTAVWTGNNSFTAFSAVTLNILLGLLAVALALYAMRARRAAPELFLLAAIGLYSLELVLITLSFFHSSHGEVAAPMPWYLQLIFPPVVLLAFAGLDRWQPLGRWFAGLNVLAWAYLGAASWLAKLVPLYGGLETAHARASELIEWYRNGSAQRASIFSTISPGSWGLLEVMLFAVLGMTLVSGGCVLAALRRQDGAGR
jgi:hypothetical protein